MDPSSSLTSSPSSRSSLSPSKGFFQWRSITTRLTLFYLLILVSSIWVVSAIGNYFLKQDLQQVSGQQQLSTATLMAAQINQEITALIKNVEGVAAQLSPALLENPLEVRSLLEKNTNLQLSFNEGVFVTDEKSEVIASTSKMVPRVDTSFMNEAFLLAAEQEEKSSIIDIVTDQRLGLPVIRVVVPLRDKKAKVIGSLFGVVNLALPNFLTALSDNRYGQTGGYLLIAPKLRVIIAATDKARIMEKLPAAGINADIDYFLSGGQGTRIFKNPLGVEIMASDVRLPISGWVLAVVLPTAEAFALLHSLQMRLLFAAGFLTALISALTWWMLSRQLAGLALANDAVALQSKDLSVAHVLPVADDDEIGELVGGFNHLLALLRERDSALIWSEQRFRAIFNAEPECVKLVAENGELLEINTAGLNMLEATTLEQVKERGLMSFILPQYHARHAELADQVLRGKASNLEFEIEGLHGTHRWLECYAIPLKNTEDGSTMMLAVTRDITQQKQAQAALIESEMRWKFAIEGSGDGLWDWNVPESTVFVSERWKEMLGYQGDEMENALAEWSKLEDWNKRVHPDDLAQVVADVKACLNGTSAIYKNEHRILCKDNSWKWILARGVVVSRDADGQPLRMIGTDSDIAEHKQLQETLQASLKEKVILLNEVHHRVKNNLQVITSLLSLENARSNAPDIQRVLKDMQGRIRSMALLHQSLYRSGIFASADLGAYLQELASQAFKAQGNRGGAISLKLDLERIMVSMDQAAPCGLLANELISNCFKHAFPDGQEGEITLGLRVLTGTNKVRFSVGDNGIGLPVDFAAKRSSSLGLQLVTDLARQIGGNLEILDEPSAQFIVDFVPDIQKMQHRHVEQVGLIN